MYEIEHFVGDRWCHTSVASGQINKRTLNTFLQRSFDWYSHFSEVKVKVVTRIRRKVVKEFTIEELESYLCHKN